MSVPPTSLCRSTGSIAGRATRNARTRWPRLADVSNISFHNLSQARRSDSQNVLLGCGWPGKRAQVHWMASFSSSLMRCGWPGKRAQVHFRRASCLRSLAVAGRGNALKYTQELCHLTFGHAVAGRGNALKYTPTPGHPACSSAVAGRGNALKYTLLAITPSSRWELWFPTAQKSSS